ncbi:MAG: hypothetical protein HQK54_04130 [Oligoflexales bacterium]|nr:hypothetical protein [Oligoflexales bacterium]
MTLRRKKAVIQLFFDPVKGIIDSHLKEKIWTDRPDLVNVVERCADGSGVSAIVLDDPRKAEYIEKWNMKRIVLARISGLDEYRKEMITFSSAFHHALDLEMKKVPELTSSDSCR